MVGGKGRECELCHLKPARLFCLADDASLCCTCDASVHSANFLVARHRRSLLCHSCFLPAGGTRNGPQIYPNNPSPLFCSSCSSLNTKHCTSHNGILAPSLSSSLSTVSFAASSSSSCNGSTVDSCNGGKKHALSVKIGRSEEEEEKETTSIKENVGISETWAISSTSTVHNDKKVSNEGSSGHCNLNMIDMPFKGKRPRQKYCKLSLSVSCQKCCNNRGSDEEEEEKELSSTNGKLGISDTPSTSSASKPHDDLSRKGSSTASKSQPYPSSADASRINRKSPNRRVSAVISKRARR